jgi:ABC-2 type transport system permease protein
MEFRGHFLLNLMIDIVWYTVQISLFEIIYLYTPSFAGLNHQAGILFLGTLFVIDCLNMLLAATNFWKFPGYINSGELDFYLLKPASVFFLTFFRYPNIASLVNLALSLSILVYGAVSYTSTIAVWQWLLWLILAINGSAVMIAFEVIVASFSVYMVNSSGLQNIFHTLYQFAMKPDSIYSQRLRRILLSIFPMALIASAPASALYAPPGILETCLLLLAGIIFCAIAGIFFQYSLRSYNGASG